MKTQALWQNEVILSITQRLTYVSTPGEKVFVIPTRVLVELPSYKIIAFGDEARPVEHAGVKQARVIVPCSALEIFDETATVVFLRAVFQMILGKAFLLKPKVYISLATQVTPFMQELWPISLYQAGARDVVTIHPLLGVAIGTGLPIAESRGYAVAWWDEDRLLLGLVAFGHVQFEHVVGVPMDLPLPEIAVQFATAWRQFLALLPTEFMTIVSRDGMVVATPLDNPALATELSRACGTPIVIVPRSAEVLGMKQRVEA